jgi:hypothetical protein
VAQAQILEAVEVEEVVDLELEEVSISRNCFAKTKLTIRTGRGGFQQRDNGPPADVLGENPLI